MAGEQVSRPARYADGPCDACVASMPAAITGEGAMGAWEEQTHLGILIRTVLGPEWHEAYLDMQGAFWALHEGHHPERLKV